MLEHQKYGYYFSKYKKQEKVGELAAARASSLARLWSVDIF